MKNVSIVALLSLGLVLVGCDSSGGSENNVNNNHLLNNNQNTNNSGTLGTLGNPCDNGACHDGSACLQNVCTAAGNPGEPCLADGTCNSDHVCYENLCYDAGAEGEACLPDGSCDTGLSCHESSCYLAGNAGELCFPDLSCNEGFACANESVQGPQECRPAVLGRVVNCLSSGSQSVDMRLIVGMVEFPEIPSMYSTPCQPIPTGGVGITMYIDGEWYEDAFVEIGTEHAEMYIQPTPTSFMLFDAACNAQLQCQ